MTENMTENKRPLTVAILYKAVGRYTVFWQDFYTSCQQYFLPEIPKHYFLFTDNHQLSTQVADNVSLYYVPTVTGINDNHPPYQNFIDCQVQLSQYTYTFFFNVGLNFVNTIASDLLTNIELNDGLMVCAHPSLYYNLEPDTWPYERNPQSLAYIPFGVANKYYIANAISGGNTKEYLQLAKTIINNIQQDELNQIHSIWGDESHLNKYLLSKHPLILPPNYLYPQGTVRLGKQLRKDIRILVLDQNNSRFGGYDYLRGKTDKKVSLGVAILQSIRSFIRHPYNHIRKLLFYLGF